MKILFALSQVEVTGAETYAVTLARALEKIGHEVSLVSDKILNPENLKFFPLPLHSQNTSYLGRVQNVFALKELMTREKIELVHAHSRAANLVSHFARKSWTANRLPMVVTVHGRWRNHFAARQLPCLGERTIAVCPYLARYLTEDIGVPSGSVRMIPNGIDTERFAPRSPGGPKETREVLFLGRFSGQKGNVIRFLMREVFPQLAREFADLRFVVAGGRVPDADRENVRLFNAGLGRESLSLVENVNDLTTIYHAAELVVGSGRVAMEAMSCGKPVVSIGESSAPGLLTESSFETAFDSNFGDCGVWNLFEKDNTVGSDLRRLLKEDGLAENLGKWGRQKAVEKFGAHSVALKVDSVYREVSG